MECYIIPLGNDETMTVPAVVYSLSLMRDLFSFVTDDRWILDYLLVTTEVRGQCSTARCLPILAQSGYVRTTVSKLPVASPRCPYGGMATPRPAPFQQRTYNPRKSKHNNSNRSPWPSG